MLPVGSQTLIRELESIKAVVDKWCEKAAEGVPGVDFPISGNTPPAGRLDVWVTELVGELQLISGKSANLASVLAETALD